MSVPTQAEVDKSRDALVAVLNYGDAVTRTDAVAGIAQQYLEGAVVGMMLWDMILEDKRKAFEARMLAQNARMATPVTPMRVQPPRPIPVTLVFTPPAPTAVLPRDNFLSIYGNTLAPMLATRPQPLAGDTLGFQVLPDFLKDFYGIVMDASMNPKVGAEVTVRPEVPRVAPVVTRRVILPPGK